MKAILVFVALVIGHYVYMLTNGTPVETLIERSYFQAWALFAYVITDKFIWRTKP